MKTALAGRLGAAPHLTLMHDGAAAAAAYAGLAHAVVITLGTAIGNGFPALHERVWPFSSTFAMASAIPASKQAINRIYPCM